MSSSASFVMKIIHNIVLKEINKFSFDEQITATDNKSCPFFEKTQGHFFFFPSKFQHFQTMYIFKGM